MTVINMIELKNGMCRWPLGNPEDKDFCFCGDKSDPELPYCKAHMAEAQAPSRKPKAAVKKAS